jgi:chromosomal replication initiator protein
METLDERFRSRFEWGLIADIQPPSYETRMAILKKNVENTGHKIDDQVLEYIANNIKSNIRELEGAVKKVNAYSRLNNVEITIENAKEALKDMIYPDKNDVVTPERIMSVVCDHYGVKAAAVMSQKKDSEIVVPRQIIMYLCKNYTDITYDAIAKMLGKKDHSTIMHGANKIKNDLPDNDELRGNIEVILKKLNIKA